MITRRYNEPRGLSENTPFYGLYVRLSGESRELFRKAHEITAKRLGSAPSNPILLDEMLKAYLKAVSDG